MEILTINADNTLGVLMPTIRAIGTAVPEHIVTQKSARQFAEHFFADQFKDIHRYLEVFVHADIESRHICVPIEWFQEPHSFVEKNSLYVKKAVQLCNDAIKTCLQEAEMTPGDIDAVILVSTTGISTPSLDAMILNELGMNPHVRRTPIWGLGCAGGAAGLARGCELARSRPKERVLVVAVELCSLTFQYGDKSKSNLIATALFADGAAAVLIEGDDIKRDDERRGLGLQFVDSTSVTWRNTLDVMGWELTDSGLNAIFSRDIPALVRTRLHEEVAQFLDRFSLQTNTISNFAAHPGGRKVLDAYQEIFETSPEKLEISRDVLRRFGNMSSVTVLFVLQAVIQSVNRKTNDYVLLFALGPGFSCEQVLLQWG